jgi:hypothetical protein
MTKKELFEALGGLPDDTHISVWRVSTKSYSAIIGVDVSVAEDDTIVPDHAHLNIYDDPEKVLVSEDDMQKVQQALMLAEMFFLATPFDVIKKSGNPLGRFLSEAIDICDKHLDH